MTVTTTPRLVGPFAGTGASASLPFAFKVFSAAEVTVSRDGTVLAADADYTVTINADQDASPGGSVAITAAAYTTGSAVWVEGWTTADQEKPLTNLGGYYPKVIEYALDRLTMLAQEVEARLSRLGFNASTPRAGLYPVFDARGNLTTSTGTGADAGLRGDLANASGSALVTFIHAGISAVARFVQDKLRETIDAADWGILPDGVTDYSTQMQALVDYCSASFRWAKIRLRSTASSAPYVLKYNHRTGVMVEGTGCQAPFTTNSQLALGTTILVPPGGGNIIGESQDTLGGGVRGIRFKGQGATPAARGIYIGVAYASYGFVAENCQFENFADEGAVFGPNAWFVQARNLFGTNLVLNHSRSGPTYAFDFNTADGTVIENVQGGPSLTVRSDATTKYVCAIRIGGTGGQNGIRANNVIGEFGDISLTLEGQNLHLGKLRAEFAMAENALVACTGSEIGSIYTTDGSKGGDASYDSVITSGNGGNVIGLVYHQGSNGSVNVRYVVNDTNPSGDVNKNVWQAVQAVGKFSALVPSTPVASGAVFGVPGGPFVLLTANSATPSANVGGRFNTRLTTNNSSATTITAITGVPDGAIITVFAADANTTIQHNGATFSLPGSGNIKLQSGYLYQFIKTTALLRLISPRPSVCFGNVGDASATIQRGTGGDSAFADTVLTANRTLTVSTTGAISGDKFKFWRTASATGAFTYTAFGKALAASQWAEGVFDGSAWQLSAYGSL